MKKLVLVSVIALITGVIIILSCRPPEVEGVVVNIQHGLYDKALTLAREAVQKYPENAEAWFYLGMLEGREGNYKAMNEAFDKCLALNPQQPVKVEGRSMTAEEAVKALRDKYFAENHNAGVAFFKKAQESEDEAAKQENLEKARDKFVAALEANPNRFESLTPLAATFLALGDTSSAETYLLQAIDRDPTNYDLILQMGDFYFKAGRYDDAEKMYKKAIQADPQKADAYMALGQLKTTQKKWEEAATYFQKALDAEPNNSVIIFNIGVSFYNQEKYAEAIPYFEKTLELEPDNEQVYEILAVCYIQAEQNDKGLEFTQKAVEKFPENATLWNYLGIFYARKGDKQKAEEAFEKSKQLGGTM